MIAEGPEERFLTRGLRKAMKEILQPRALREGLKVKLGAWTLTRGRNTQNYAWSAMKPVIGYQLSEVELGQRRCMPRADVSRIVFV